MATAEHLTIILPAETASILKDAMAEGVYASTSDVVNEALLVWEKARMDALTSLKNDIGIGLRDLAEGRVHDLDRSRIEALRKRPS